MTAAQSVLHLPERASDHFPWSEFRCHDQIGTEYPIDWRISRGVPLAAELERIRTRIGKFVPTSIFRTKDYHRSLYAAMRQQAPMGSQHLFGRAADIPCPKSMPWKEFSAAILDSAKEPGSRIRYIRLYMKSRFAHVDIRDRDELLIEVDA